MVSLLNKQNITEVAGNRHFQASVTADDANDNIGTTNDKTNANANIIGLTSNLFVDLNSPNDTRRMVIDYGHRTILIDAIIADSKAANKIVTMQSLISEIMLLDPKTDARAPYLRAFIAFFAKFNDLRNVTTDEQVSYYVKTGLSELRSSSLNEPSHMLFNKFGHILADFRLKIAGSKPMTLYKDGWSVENDYSTVSTILDALTAEIKHIVQNGEKLLNSDELASENKLFYALSAGIITTVRPQLNDDMPIAFNSSKYALLQHLTGSFYRLEDGRENDFNPMGVFSLKNKVFLATNTVGQFLVDASKIVSLYYNAGRVYKKSDNFLSGYESSITPLRQNEPKNYALLQDYSGHKVIIVENTPQSSTLTGDMLKKRRAIFYSLGLKQAETSNFVFITGSAKNAVFTTDDTSDLTIIKYNSIFRMILDMPSKACNSTPKTEEEIQSYMRKHGVLCVKLDFCNSCGYYNSAMPYKVRFTKTYLCSILKHNSFEHYIALDQDTFYELKLAVSRCGNSYENTNKALHIAIQAMLKNGVIPDYTTYSPLTEVYFVSYYSIRSINCIKYLESKLPTTKISENYVIDDNMRQKLDSATGELARILAENTTINMFNALGNVVMNPDYVNFFSLLYEKLNSCEKYEKTAENKAFLAKIRVLATVYDNAVQTVKHSGSQCVDSEKLKFMEFFLLFCQSFGYKIPDYAVDYVNNTAKSTISLLKSVFSDYPTLENSVADSRLYYTLRDNTVKLNSINDAVNDAVTAVCASKIRKNSEYVGNMLKDDNMAVLCSPFNSNAICYKKSGVEKIDKKLNGRLNDLSKQVWENLRQIVNIKDDNVKKKLGADFGSFGLFMPREIDDDMAFYGSTSECSRMTLCYYNLSLLFNQLDNSPYPYEYNKQAALAKIPEILPFLGSAFCKIPKIV